MNKLNLLKNDKKNFIYLFKGNEYKKWKSPYELSLGGGW